MKGVVRFLVMLCVASAIVIVVTTIERAEYLFGTQEYHVSVINGFNYNSSEPLIIWCSSLEAELGSRALQEQDDFSWIMRLDFWGSNYMKCTVKWDEMKRSFDAFMASRDTFRCGPFRMCYWLVTPHGFFFSNDRLNWRKQFLWTS